MELEQRLRCSFFENRLKDWRQDSPTLWRWNVMSPTTITTSLGNPVVQNLTSTDAQIRDHTTRIHHTGKRTREQLLCLPCLAFGAGRHRRRRRLRLLSSHLPCVLPPPLHRRTILSGTAPGRHFLEGTAGPWDSGKGKLASLAIMVSYLSIPVFCLGGEE